MIDKKINNKLIMNYEDYNLTQLQTTLSANSMATKTSYDDNNDDLKKKLMEKDRTIIDHLRTIKDQERKIEELNKYKEDFEEKNQSMLNEINNVSIQLKHKESIINNQKEEIQIIQNKTDKIIAAQQNDNNKQNKTIEELKNITKLNEESRKKWIEEKDKLLLLIKSKDQIIQDNKSLNEKNDNIIKQLKNDNKQILSLKRQINEYEDIISNSKKEIINMQMQYDIIAKEKEKIEYVGMQKHQINKTIDIKGETVEDNNTMSLDYQRLKKENEALNAAKTELSLKYQNIQGDFDAFVKNVIIQIGKITNELEADRIIQSSPSKIITIRNETVGDLIQKSLGLLNQSIISKLQSNNQQLDTLLNSNKELETANNNLMNDKSSLIKANAFLTTQSSQYSNEHNEQLQALNQLSKDYTNLKNSYMNLKGEYEKLTQDIEIIGKQSQSFLNSLIEKIYPEMQNDNINLSMSDKIIRGIDAIISSNKYLSNKMDIIESKSLVLSKDNYNKLINENKELKLEVNCSKKVINSNEYELQKKEEDIVLKVKELNRLLLESNQLVIDYENQLKDMKERNKKLENNLEMLTKSHYQIEQAISTNDTHIKEEYNTLQEKYTTLIREIELKDIHIQSLEKFQSNSRKINNKSFIGKLLNKGKGINQSIESKSHFNSTSLDNESNNNESNIKFIRNEEKEKQLQKMLIETISTQENNKEKENSNNTHSQIGKIQSNKPKTFFNLKDINE